MTFRYPLVANGTSIQELQNSDSLNLGVSANAVNPTITNYTESLYANTTPGSAFTVNLSNGTIQQLTLGSNITITMPPVTAGKSFLLMLLQNSTGGYSVTWSTVKWPSGTAPTFTSTANKQDMYSFFSDGTYWYGVTIGQSY